MFVILWQTRNVVKFFNSLNFRDPFFWPLFRCLYTYDFRLVQGFKKKEKKNINKKFTITKSPRNETYHIEPRCIQCMLQVWKGIAFPSWIEISGQLLEVQSVTPESHNLSKRTPTATLYSPKNVKYILFYKSKM